MKFSKKTPQRIFLLLFVAFSFISFNGCGWHLAGTLPGESTKAVFKQVNLVKQVKNRDYALAIERTFKLQGITIDSKASTTLALLELSLERKPYAYSSTGNPVQYQLEMTATYSFHATDTTQVPEIHTAVSRRQFDFQPTAIIAKTQEEESLKREMYREISQKILNQAAYFKPEQ